MARAKPARRAAPLPRWFGRWTRMAPWSSAIASVVSVEPSLATMTRTGTPNSWAGIHGRRVRSLSASLKAGTTTAITLAPPHRAARAPLRRNPSSSHPTAPGIDVGEQAQCREVWLVRPSALEVNSRRPVSRLLVYTGAGRFIGHVKLDRRAQAWPPKPSWSEPMAALPRAALPPNSPPAQPHDAPPCQAVHPARRLTDRSADMIPPRSSWDDVAEHSRGVILNTKPASPAAAAYLAQVTIFGSETRCR